MNGKGSEIPGVFVRGLPSFDDARGSFRETFRQSWFPGPVSFVQGNASASVPHVLRGMHYHLSQDDYWVLLRGSAVMALADLRGWHGRAPAPRVEMHDLAVGDAVFIPRGVAHGFYAREDLLLTYLVTGYYDGSDELGVAWNDPDLAIPWPCTEPILSPRDRQNPRLRDIEPARLPGPARPPG
jgi:dTDP-4-dehydrorhamnose 3,5-epimerase